MRRSCRRSKRCGRHHCRSLDVWPVPAGSSLPMICSCRCKRSSSSSCSTSCSSSSTSSISDNDAASNISGDRRTGSGASSGDASDPEAWGSTRPGARSGLDSLAQVYGAANRAAYRVLNLRRANLRSKWLTGQEQRALRICLREPHPPFTRLPRQVPLSQVVNFAVKMWGVSAPRARWLTWASDSLRELATHLWRSSTCRPCRRCRGNAPRDRRSCPHEARLLRAMASV
mmetsp:Transcript_492/g.1149  ORF Transcript_492/g.1149 Transcript_492/m.1149 type:complete len:229 (-) Transcript_492:114-800(-)